MPDLSQYVDAVAIDTETLYQPAPRPALRGAACSAMALPTLSRSRPASARPTLRLCSPTPPSPRSSTMPVSTLPRLRLRHQRRSWCSAPRSPRGSLAPIPTAMYFSDITAELLGISLSKQQQSSDWGAPELTPEQPDYAASDVLHLHACARRRPDGRPAKDARPSPMPVSASRRHAPGSTSLAGPRKTSSRIAEVPGLVGMAAHRPARSQARHESGLNLRHPSPTIGMGGLPAARPAIMKGCRRTMPHDTPLIATIVAGL